MHKKGFTLIEIIAVIAIIGIIGIITVPNVLEYFTESKIEAMIIQENKLVESGDILVRDYCKNPINDDYQLQCDEFYKGIKTTDESVIDNNEKTYTRYICLSKLKELNYYSETLQYSKTECNGAVVYIIDEDTDIQKESFSVVKCGDDYKTIFGNEKDQGYEEFLENNNTRANELINVFTDCFEEETPEPEQTKEYMLTIKYTEYNPYGVEIASTVNEKVESGTLVSKDVPPYQTGTGTNIEVYSPFIHSSTTRLKKANGTEEANQVKIVNNKVSFKMPAHDVTVYVTYSINQYTVTFNHIDSVLRTSKGESQTYQIFNGESVDIPYKDITNFKIVSHNKETQKTYTLNEHDNKTIDIEYQQIKFNVAYDSNGGTACASTKKEYLAKFGTLCTTTRDGYEFAGWYLNGNKVTSDTINYNYNDITLVANWSAKEYQITYYMGNGSSTAGVTKIGEKKCIYDQSCTLDTFASLGTEFKCSSDPNYGWRFDGWSSTQTGMTVNYTNGKSFTYNIADNLNLYALGKRTLNINSGIKPTTIKAQLEQRWNPYSTSTNYLTEISLPAATAIGNGWSFRGYKGGSTEADITAVTFTSSQAGTTFKANYNVYPQMRSIYERTLTMSYNGNNATSGSTSSQTTTQYYSSGYVSSGTNYKEQISSPTITLRENGFTKTGYTFSKWAKGSTSGTQYSASSSYTFAPGVSASNSQTMYAIWDRNKYYVAYDCNGGTGTMSESQHEYDIAKTLNDSKCTKNGSVFTSWNTKADKTGTSYSNKQSVINLTTGQSSRVILYAQYTMCPAGYYCPGASDKTACPDGYTSNAGATSISSCYINVSAGKYIATARTKTQTSCATGTYKGTHTVNYGDTSSCESCPTGYTDGSGTTARTNCIRKVTAGNYIKTANDSSNTSCAAGTYQTAHEVKYGNTSSCETCPDGYTSAAGATAQSSCYINVSAGKYIASARTKTQTSCATGTYKGTHTVNYGNTSSCESCPTGYTDGSGTTAKTNCVRKVTAGNYIKTANDSSNTSCAAGTYKAAHEVKYGGTSSCSKCSAGTYSAAGLASCSTCPSGYTSDEGATAQNACYMNVSANYYVSSSGAQNATACSTGYNKAAHKVNYGGTSSCSANTYTVKYSSNGGTGTTNDSSHTYDTAKSLNENKFTRTGYTFNGWNTKADGTGTSYTDKQSVKNLSNTNLGTVTLHAQWTLSGTKFGEYLLSQKGSNYLSSSLVGGMYRYQGTYSQVTKNYVCFGSTSCSGATHDNMYRVMGVTSDGYVKLIKNIPLSAQQFHTANDETTWKNSSLKSKINGSLYYSNLGSSWQDNIANRTWYYVEDTYAINLNTLYNNYTGEQVYEYETGNEEASASVSAKVGLMNMSDYLFAMGNNMNCNEDYQNYTTGSDSPCKDSWIELYNTSTKYNGNYLEWLMSTYGKSSGIYYAMGIRAYEAVITNDFAGILETSKRTRVARPVIYVTQDTLKTGGSGTSSDPYILLP